VNQNNINVENFVVLKNIDKQYFKGKIYFDIPQMIIELINGRALSFF